MKKTVLTTAALLAGLGVIAKSQAPEIQRYLKMKRM
jgi:hypothetical protein